MKEQAFPENTERFCIVDVGSTTTKAVLFVKEGAWRFLRAEAPTTVEKPHEDVSVGLLNALRRLEQTAGATLVRDNEPAVPLLATSSAGGGLAMVVTGLVHDITARSADLAALGAGAIVLDVIAMDDGRTPYRKIEDLKTLRPDMVLLAGGFDADNITGPVYLAELILEAGLSPKLSPDAPLPLLYAGNIKAVDEVRSAVGDRMLFRAVANVRPGETTENYGPARRAIHELFMDHVMSHAPGYERLLGWVAAPIMPTPAAFGQMLELVSGELNRRILAVDVGGATTDVFSVEPGKVFRSVSANLGLSYSVLNVCAIAGPAAIAGLLDFEIAPAEVWNRVAAKHIHPTRLPDNDVDMRLEWALAAVAIREAVRCHLALLRGTEPPIPSTHKDINDLLRERRKRPAPRAPVELGEYQMLLGSGGILSHSPRPAAARVLVDALRPGAETELALDNEFILPHLGALASIRPELTRQLFRELALVNMGKASNKSFVYVAGYVPPASPDLESVMVLRKGLIELRRELAVPGTVLVKTGDTVVSNTVVARSTRQFLRPFFLHAAEAIGVPAGELPKYLKKKVGDAIDYGDTIAFRHKRFVNDVHYRSPVRGRFERLLPSGVLLVRESPEEAREYTTVDVAKELGVERDEILPYLRVEKGQEIERGQWLAAIVRPDKITYSESPVRGRVNRIEKDMGMVVIEPLLEELSVHAWLPGKVTEATERGCTVSGSGTTITGVWGRGSERSGMIDFSSPGPDKLFVTEFAGAGVVAQVEAAAGAGLVAAGVNVADALDPEPGFTLVVTEGFGRREFTPAVKAALEAAVGRLGLIDGRTMLRVGVRRPFVILPD